MISVLAVATPVHAGPVTPGQVSLSVTAGTGAGANSHAFVGQALHALAANGTAAAGSALGTAHAQAEVTSLPASQLWPSASSHSVATWNCCGAASGEVSATSAAHAQLFARITATASLPLGLPFSADSLSIPLVALVSGSLAVIDGYSQPGDGLASATVFADVRRRNDATSWLTFNASATDSYSSQAVNAYGAGAALTRDELEITLDASSQALAFGSAGGVAEGGAQLDAYLLFDQFTFDTAMADLGVTSFALQDYFAIEYGINHAMVPEPESTALLALGLAGLMLRRGLGQRLAQH